MSAQDTEQKAMRGYRDFAAPLIGIAVLVAVVLGFSAYWWQMARVSVCRSSDLKLSLGQPQGTAGTTYMDAILTNIGGRSCQVGGYPAAFLADVNGAILGSGATSTSQIMPTDITLAQNASAHSILGFPDAANFQPGSCSVASKFLQLYPPGQTLALRTSFTQYSCPGFSVTALKSGP